MYHDLLKKFYSILNKCNTELCNKDKKGKCLFVGIEQLKDAVCNYSNNNCCLRSMRISLPEVPSHTKPDNIGSIDLYLEVEVDYLTNNTANPVPITIKSFNVILKSDSGQMISWHLDSDSAGNSNKYLHPYFHITFGGRIMENAIENRTHDFGQTLVMRNPRFMHPPMDIILGIDFILNHYVSRDYAQYFLGDKEYQDIIKKMQDCLWKPYALAFAKNYCSKLTANGIPFTLGTNFCKKIIGG